MHRRQRKTKPPCMKLARDNITILAYHHVQAAGIEKATWLLNPGAFYQYNDAEFIADAHTYADLLRHAP